MTGRRFWCARCRREFISEWSEEEARAEQKLNGFADMECAQICDDCYKAFMDWARHTALLPPIN